MMIFYLLYVLYHLLSYPHPSTCGHTSLWDFCGCSWEPWEPWQGCSKECNGVRERNRPVRLYTNKDGCPFKFTTCATVDMGSDTSRCNAFCYNGGTSNSYSCSCVSGFYGDCCGFQVNCGHPGTISNGNVNGGVYTYGATVTYTCHSDYLLVEGDSSRTCHLNAVWSGTKPRCAYIASCSSGPCQNGASCMNIPDDYVCTCVNGWSGKNCDADIQPPVMANCSKDIDTRTASLTGTVQWQIPEFWDPLSFELQVTHNYPKNEYTFPWGDFNVSYSAIKPSNGLSAECLFTIQVRPNPCPAMNVPVNGALICNNWKIDYGQFCIFFCQESYTVPRGEEVDDFYVCGASGSWTPSNTMPDCSVRIMGQQPMVGYSVVSTYNNCTEKYGQMQKFYLEKLKGSAFGYFCDKFPSECTEENVLIKC